MLGRGGGRNLDSFIQRKIVIFLDLENLNFLNLKKIFFKFIFLFISFKTLRQLLKLLGNLNLPWAISQ